MKKGSWCWAASLCEVEAESLAGEAGRGLVPTSHDIQPYADISLCWIGGLKSEKG
jgi:hypothetical protein